MDVFIYVRPGFGHARDVVEDAIEEFLAGKGEVTGGGSGDVGSNIDIEVFEGDHEWVLAGIRRVLGELGVPRDCTIEIEGQQFPLYP